MAPQVSDSASREKRPAPRGTAAYPRKRGNTACQVCRARRTKCEGQTPCNFCLKSGAKCIRSPVDLSSFDPASLQILERIEDLSREFRTWRDEQRSQTSRPVERISWLFPSSAEAVLLSDTPHLLAILKASSVTAPLCTSSPASTFADLEPQSIKILTENFFDYVHVKNPILDEHATKNLLSHLVLHGMDWSDQSCLALLVCALGSLATPFGPSSSPMPGSSLYSNSQSYFLAAQKRLGLCFVEGGLLQAQCLFLAGVYLMSVFKPLEAWRMFSQSLACCQSFAFLIDTNNTGYGLSNNDWSSNMVAEQAVYWSSWKSEREIRWDLRPPDFCPQETQPVEYPKFFPTPPPPAETDTARQARAWTFYLTEISLRRQSLMISADIAENQNDIGSLMQMLPHRMAQIEDWLKAIPQTMSLETPPEADDVCKFVIRGHVMNLYEMLHWPFLAHYIDAQVTNPPLLKSLAETALVYHVQRILINKPGFFHRHHGTWFMIRTCSRSATLLLRCAHYNEQHPENELFLPENWYTAVMDVIELHRFWKSEAPDAAVRLEEFETLIARFESHVAGDRAETSSAWDHITDD